MRIVGLLAMTEAHLEGRRSIDQSRGIGAQRWWAATANASTRQLRFSREAVERIIELKRAGHGLQRIGEILTDEGFATPLGGRWWPGTVRKALINEAAAGDVSAAKALAMRAERVLGRYGGLRAAAADVSDDIVRLHLDERQPSHRIAEILDANHVPTTRGGRQWHQSTVRSVLSSRGVAPNEQP